MCSEDALWYGCRPCCSAVKSSNRWRDNDKNVKQRNILGSSLKWATGPCSEWCFSGAGLVMTLTWPGLGTDTRVHPLRRRVRRLSSDTHCNKQHGERVRACSVSCSFFFWSTDRSGSTAPESAVHYFGFVDVLFVWRSVLDRGLRVESMIFLHWLGVICAQILGSGVRSWLLFKDGITQPAAAISSPIVIESGQVECASEGVCAPQKIIQLEFLGGL